MATEFAISRFAVPFLRQKGFALFCDCDILCMEDIAGLFDEANPAYAVQVVKHEYAVTDTTKMVDKAQTSYPRKNWSSVVLWNCEHPAHKALTNELLNTVPGRDLHRFFWLGDQFIGSLSPKWNQLVGVHDIQSDKGMLHFTNGGPWLEGWKGGHLDDVWSKAAAELNL